MSSEMPQISRASFGMLMTRLFGLNRSPAFSNLTAQQRTQLHTLIGQNADDQSFFFALGVSSPPAASGDGPAAAAPYISEQAQQLDGEVSAPSPSAASSSGRVDAANGNVAVVTGNNSSAPPAASGQVPSALERFKRTLAKRHVPPEVPQSTKKRKVVHIAPKAPRRYPGARQHYQIHLGHGLPNPIFNQVHT